MGLEGKRFNPDRKRGAEQSAHAVLMSTVLRYNEQQEQMGSPAWKIPVDSETRFDLTLPEDGVNNQLVVRVGKPYRGSDGKEHMGGRYVHIAHYDPAQEKFLAYPELISQEDFSAVEEVARKTREAHKAQRTDFDMDADVVKDLRRRHKEVLEEDGLVYKIAERYRNLSPEEKLAGVNEYLIDDSTSVHACLTPKLGGYNRSDPSSVQAGNLFITDDAFVSISLHGDLFRDKGVMQRRASSYIHIGSRDLDDPEGKFVPNRKLVTDDEFGKILELTSELQQVKTTSQPNLDIEMVALKKKPKFGK